MTWDSALANRSLCPLALQLQQLDLAGATALGDADLLPLRQLTALTTLSLAGLWRVTVRGWSRAGCHPCPVRMRCAAKPTHPSGARRLLLHLAGLQQSCHVGRHAAA